MAKYTTENNLGPEVSNFLSNCVLHLVEKRWKCFIGMSNLKKYKIGKQQTSGPNRNKYIKHNEQGRK